MRMYRRPERIVDPPPRRGNVLPAVSGEIIVPEPDDGWPEGSAITTVDELERRGPSSRLAPTG
ncbi:MAG: hypothetical protein ACM31C_03220 [Acidobacteriota bacterium]